MHELVVPGPSTGPNREFFFWAIVTAFALLVTSVSYLDEDAFIVFRVVDNFVNGYGLRWNVDERVQVFTCPLWVLLLIPVHFLFGDIATSSYVLSAVVSVTAFALVTRRLILHPLQLALTFVLPLFLSQAFTDFTSSGLENPLLYLFLAWAVVRGSREELSSKSLFPLTLVASLSAVTRLGSLLLYLPLLLYLQFRSFTWKQLRLSLIGALPLLIWLGFSLVYFGSFFPNPAYAKLGAGIEFEQYLRLGFNYALDSARNDTVTFVYLFMVAPVFTVMGLRSTDEYRYQLALLTLGSLVYQTYIISIGGDFMAGRHFAAPFFLTVSVLALAWSRTANPGAGGSTTWLFLALIVCRFAIQPILMQRDVIAPREQGRYGIERDGHIKWQRFNCSFYESLFGSRGPPEQHSWSKTGLEHRRKAAALARADQKDKYVAVDSAAGKTAFYAGPQVYFVDQLGITDLLLARLPDVDGKMHLAGHLWRELPGGYVTARRTGSLSEMNPDLARYYDALRRISTEPLFSTARWSLILRMQLGIFDGYLEAYLAGKTKVTEVRPGPFAEAQKNAAAYASVLGRVDRVISAVLKEADPTTLLIPDHFSPDPAIPNNRVWYTPHNSGADLYPYLVIGSFFANKALYQGRMLEMLRNELRYTSTVKSIPGSYNFRSRLKGRPSLFGAGEYAKDGLAPITELLGRTPWYWRMHEMTIDAMEFASVESKFGSLPASDTELNGDFLQVLPRLYWMSGEQRFLDWGRRIADAYVKEVLPGSFDLPSKNWDFKKHRGDSVVKFRDHGNETIVGLTLMFAAEKFLKTPRAPVYEAALSKMFDRIISSANKDGMLFNEIDAKTLRPIHSGLIDNWGYVYGALYNMYLLTNEEKYLSPIKKVLKSLPRYINFRWEGSHYDGYADSVESAIYLLNRMPDPQTLEWIESEVQVMLRQQKPDGHIDGIYLEGNYIRTSILYMLMKSQGISLDGWRTGVGVGAAFQPKGKNKNSLAFSIIDPSGKWRGRVRFDYRRHRRIMNLPMNLWRLNEFPEWFTVEENASYEIGKPMEKAKYTYLGSELIAGIELSPGDWTIAMVHKPQS